MTSDSAASAAPPKPSRAGRDLSAAIGVGVGLGAVIIASLFVVKEAFLLVVLAAGGIGMWELGKALRTASVHVPLVPVHVGGGVMLLGSYYGGAEALSVTMALTMIAIVVFQLAEGVDGFVRDATAGVFVTAYVPLLGSFVVLMLTEADGPWRIVVFVVTTIASDTGGYLAGALLGKHPMAPRISPKKSWEGFIGSVLGCMLAGWLTVAYGLDGPVWVGLLLGVVVATIATIGDLGESVIKRDLGIKDMGTLLPGHGGMMDRLDSLLVVAPVCWLVLHLLVPVA
ncbi:MAG: phosphatidate cytidylyltransferase [Actinomycetota bacterium]|nr:phosphatidate cytidylyltransferase [Actinomycetota bacterium]